MDKKDFIYISINGINCIVVSEMKDYLREWILNFVRILAMRGGERSSMSIKRSWLYEQFYQRKVAYSQFNRYSGLYKTC